MTERIIHTGLYSDKFFTLLTNMKHLNYGSKGDRRNLSFATIERATDNEVVIRTENNSGYNYYRTIYYKYTEDAKVLDWFGWYMKCMLKNDYPSAEWKRNNMEKVDFYDQQFSIAEIYYLYEYLRNRKRAEGKYSAEIIDGWKGKPLDPIAAELEFNRREEVKRIKEKYAAFINDCDWSDYRYSWRTNKTAAAAELAEAIKKVEDEITAKWNAKKAEYEKQMNTEITELNEMCKQTIAFSTAN